MIQTLMSGEEEISMTLERLDYLLIIESLHEKLKRMEPDSVEYKKCNEILKEYREKLKGME
jgi:hypothetical protein